MPEKTRYYHLDDDIQVIGEFTLSMGRDVEVVSETDVQKFGRILLKDALFMTKELRAEVAGVVTDLNLGGGITGAVVSPVINKVNEIMREKGLEPIPFAVLTSGLSETAKARFKKESSAFAGFIFKDRGHIPQDIRAQVDKVFCEWKEKSIH